MIFNIKKIKELKNKNACDVCGTKCSYYYNKNFQLRKNKCLGFKLKFLYKIILHFF